MYETVLFDLDHTLLDSHESEARAYEATMRGVGITDPASHFAPYDRINKELWRAVEQGAIRPDDVRHTRFERLVTERGLDADPAVMADLFVKGLGENGDLYPGAQSLLEHLAGMASLALVTNGISIVQRTRIERLGIADLFDAIIISAEVGSSKPGTEIFDLAFGALREPNRDTALMVGDSLTSDIAGGVNYGIDTCWYHPEQHGVTITTPEPTPTYIVTHIEHVRSIVEG